MKICIKNTASESFLTTVPLTVRLDTQNSQFKLGIDETLPFSQTLSVSLNNNEYVDVFIQFTPQTEGLITSTIEILSNDPFYGYVPDDEDTILLTGMGVPDTDGDSYMDYNDDPDLNDPDSDNDGLSDSLEGGDDPDESSKFRSIDSDGNGISDAVQTILEADNIRYLNVNFQPLFLGDYEIKTPTGFIKDIGEEFTTPTEQIFGWWDDIDMTPYTGCSVEEIVDLYNPLSQTYIDVPSTFSVSVVWKADFSDIPGKYRFIAIVEDTDDYNETPNDLVKITDVRSSGNIRTVLEQDKADEGELKTINTTIFLDSETDFFELYLAPGTRIYYLQFVPIVTAAFNFQPDPAGDPPCLTPAGFIADYGVGYLEDSGYGWFDNADFDTSYTLDSGHFVRTDPDGYTNQIINTYVEFPYAEVSTGFWAMRLPVGTYRVIATVGGPTEEKGPHSVEMDQTSTNTIYIFNGSSSNPDDTTGDDQPSTKTLDATIILNDNTDSIEDDGYGLLRVIVNGAGYETTLCSLVILDEINDFDEDGLNAAQEQTIGTDPNVADTDGDGLDDGAEYYSRWNIPATFLLNDEGNACSNSNINWDDDIYPEKYIKYHTKSFNGKYYLVTDPKDTDSDDDGVPDGDDGTSDSDGDGLPNCLDPDSDNDGVRDGTEMGYTLYGYRMIHTGEYEVNDAEDLLPNGEMATVYNILSTNTEADWFKGDDTNELPEGDPDNIPDYASSEFFDYAEFKATIDAETSTIMYNFIADTDPPTDEDDLNEKTTYPYKRDTDGDFVPDGTFYIPFAGAAKRYKGEDRDNDGCNTETFNTTYPPDLNISETDPRNKESVPEDCLEDTDGDGLADEYELFIGSDIYDKDTDDDGLSDGDEYYGKGQNERWFGVKTDACHPDNDRDGLPDGLELGITDKIYDFVPINPQVEQFGGTAYDAESEDDKYFFYTQAPDGETRKIRRFISDGDPDSMCVEGRSGVFVILFY